MHESFIKPELLDVYFKTEALEKPAEVFRKVHTPADRIAVDFYREGDYHKFASEEQIATWVLSSRGDAPGNRIFTVTGETGSGKSELCQHIRYRATETKGHVPILISRSKTRLRDIVSLLHEHIGEPEPDDIGEITEMPTETVVHAAVTECLLALEALQAFQKYDPDQRQKLRQILQDVAFGRLIERAFNRYRNEVRFTGKERDLKLMDLNEFDNLMSGAAKWLNTKEAFPLFLSRVNDGMKRLVSLGDIKKRLGDIASRYQAQGKRPVLILEDLTSFGFVKDDLLDYLFDLSAGNFDVLIGWTTGFEAEQLFNNPNPQMRSYMLDRMRGRFLMTSDERASYFLEEKHLPLVRRYIDAVRDSAQSDRIPDPFYPLNPFAVSRIYQHLLDKGQPKRTPRLLIDVIGQILRSSLAPWQEIETHHLGSSLQDWQLEDRFVPLKDKYPDAVALARWYGRPGDGRIDRKTVQLLGLVWPVELAHLLSDEPIWQDAPISTPVEVEQLGPEPKESEKGISENKPLTGTPGTKVVMPVVPAPEVDQDLLDLQRWLDGRDYPSRKKLKDGFAALADLVEDHTAIGNPRGQLVAVKYDKTTLPIVMAGTNDLDVDYPAIRVQPKRDQYEFFRSCIRINGAKAAEAALAESPRLAAWVAGLIEDYRRSQRLYLAQRIGMPIESFVFHAYRVVRGMNDGLAETDDRLFAVPVLAGDSLLSRTGGLRNLPNLRNLMRLRHTIAGLYKSFFFINGSTADADKLVEAVNAYDFAKFNAALTRPGKVVDPGFKVTVATQEVPDHRAEKSLHELWQLVRTACGEIAAAANNLDPERAVFAPIVEMAGYATGLTVPDVRRHVQILRTLAAQNQVMEREGWKRLKEVDEGLDLATLAGSLTRLTETVNRAGSAFKIMEAHRMWLSLESAPVYQCLHAVEELVHEVGEALGMLSEHRNLASAQMRFAEADRAGCEATYGDLTAALEG